MGEFDAYDYNDCSIMTTDKLTRILCYVAAVIFLLVPFQALLTTWLGSNFGHLDLFRIWKELLLVVLAVGSLYLVYRDKKLKKWFINSPLVLLIALYIILQLSLGIYALTSVKVNNSAVIYALLINCRLLIFFLACLILAAKSDWLVNNWRKIILWPAVVVISFGILQHFILPNDFLRHFGYGPSTIRAYQAVDQKPQYIRLQSTLRGPNPLGAYLVLILTTLAILFMRNKKRTKVIVLIAASLVVLYFTYSRSAWLGVFVSCLLVGFWSIKNKQKRQWLIFGSLAASLVLIISVLVWHKNSVLENTLFHTSQTSQSPESSNAARTEAMLDGAKDVVRQPLGDGPGTAGPASFRNNHPARIAENYFIQIGQEVGILGIGLFVAINLYIALGLWKIRDNDLAKIALAALIGLTLVNLLSHAWADDTLVYTFWGLAGIALAPSVILNKERKPTHAKD